jgi:enoyl-CoA hydratase/carnithine racemase
LIHGQDGRKDFLKIGANGHGRLRNHRQEDRMKYQAYSTLQVEVDAGVAWLTINHPPINLLDGAMVGDLARAGEELQADDAVRVVVLRSAVPEFFIAHADVRGILAFGDAAPAVARASLEAFHAAVDRFRTMPQATIAQIEGRCRGGGSELALACDMRFAARDRALLSQPEVALGIIPGGGGSARLPRLMGRGRALEVTLGCADFDADLAERYGYVNRTLPADRIAEFVETLARRIAGFPAEALRLAKEAVTAQQSDLPGGLAAERDCFLRSAASPEARRLMAAALDAGLQTFEVETAPRIRA